MDQIALYYSLIIPLIPKGNFYKSAYFEIIREKRVLATKTEPIYSMCACQQNSTIYSICVLSF